MIVNFEDFSLGDTICFSKQFSKSDFKSFSELSGDKNPLHHSDEYARMKGDGATIVPFHMIISPLSKIAGMHFPGDPSLYLSHNLRAVSKLRYGETICYSAQITELYAAKRVLKIRIVGTAGTTIIFDGEMYTQSLHAEWEQDYESQVYRINSKKRVLITGATGEIATSVANRFVNEGWPLLLQTRTIDSRLEQFLSKHSKCDIEIIEADLNKSCGLERLTSTIESLGDVYTVIHAASPPIDASMKDLVQVNYTALKVISQAVLPNMLRHQKGKVISIGSTAMLTHINGLEDYAASKVLAANFLSHFDATFGAYGIRGNVLAPDLVATKFSKNIRGEKASLMPAEVGEKIFDIATNSNSFMTVQYMNSISKGSFGFSGSVADEISTEQEKKHPLKKKKIVSDRGDSIEEELILCAQKILPKASDKSLRSGGLGITPGWDSLAQIQILLEVESHFGHAFSAADYDELKSFHGILASLGQMD